MNKIQMGVNIKTNKENNKEKEIIKSIMLDRGYWHGKGVKPLYNIKNNNDTTLYAFYDLEKSPSGFDINVFLTLADIFRKKITCDSIHVIIVPGSNSGFRSTPNPDRTDKWDLDNMRWRLRNLMPNCCWLLPSCTAVSILETRNEAENISKYAKFVYPEKYSVHDPSERCNWTHLFRQIFKDKSLELPLKAPDIALAQVKRWLDFYGNKKFVSLNLRESVETPRNSNLDNWKEFAKYLKMKDYTPIFVRDAEQNLGHIPPSLNDEILFPEANHLAFRSALYELCDMNMFVNNGTASLAWFNGNVKYIMCKILSAIPEYTSCGKSFLEHSGFKIGENPPFANAGQKWIWNYEDDTGTLISAFQDLCK